MDCAFSFLPFWERNVFRTHFVNTRFHKGLNAEVSFVWIVPLLWLIDVRAAGPCPQLWNDPASCRDFVEEDEAMGMRSLSNSWSIKLLLVLLWQTPLLRNDLDPLVLNVKDLKRSRIGKGNEMAKKCRAVIFLSAVIQSHCLLYRLCFGNI